MRVVPQFEILCATSAFSAVKVFQPIIHRRDAEVAEITQRKLKLGRYRDERLLHFQIGERLWYSKTFAAQN